MKILVINPGSTSTKIGYFIDDKLVTEKNCQHDTNELAAFNTINKQLPYRLTQIMLFIKEAQINLDNLDAIVSRGGILPPVAAGAYIINADMINYLLNITKVEHPSNLGAAIAEQLKKSSSNSKMQIFIYDPVSVDEYHDLARISGLKGVPRESLGHALNMRAVAMKVAHKYARPYIDMNIIVAHLGGGNTISIHAKGKMIDSISDDEGPFSTERTGGLPLKKVIAMCYQHTEKEMMTLYKKRGGLLSYTGTNDARIIEKEIKEGNKEFKLIYDALAYQVAKGIGSLATVVYGDIDAIIITGGLAHSKYLTDILKQRLTFISPIEIVAGEDELQALNNGISRVLAGKETANIFIL